MNLFGCFWQSCYEWTSWKKSAGLQLSTRQLRYEQLLSCTRDWVARPDSAFGPPLSLVKQAHLLDRYPVIFKTRLINKSLDHFEKNKYSLYKEHWFILLFIFNWNEFIAFWLFSTIPPPPSFSLVLLAPFVLPPSLPRPSLN
jgi:hypothetical protein